MNQPADLQQPYFIQHRTPDHPVDSVFLQRWSPRAYDASRMPMADLLTILEAARWAPSAFNLQPWRFVYAMREDACWGDWLELLDPFNADWAKHASALVFVASDRLVPGDGAAPARESQTHSFDTGAAWAHLALQATTLGYHAHAMAGVHFDRVRQRLSIPERFRVEIAVAVGRRAAPSALPPALREREVPSPRMPLEAIAFAGSFAAQTGSGNAAQGDGS